MRKPRTRPMGKVASASVMVTLTPKAISSPQPAAPQATSVSRPNSVKMPAGPQSGSSAVPRAKSHPLMKLLPLAACAACYPGGLRRLFALSLLKKKIGGRASHPPILIVTMQGLIAVDVEFEVLVVDFLVLAAFANGGNRCGEPVGQRIALAHGNAGAFAVDLDVDGQRRQDLAAGA